MNVSVNLSKLIAGRMNPRRVKPEREAHRRLVASIRAHGLLEPLVVHTIEEGKYRVIAGNRRLSALREVHRGEDARVPCIAKDVDDDTAASMSLAENFAREPMHPLDEAEAFARLASEERKGVATIAGEFGVSDTYVRQRMKLAGLATPVKAALRSNDIGVSVAEAFAAVPTDRQEELWKETGGSPRHAQHVKNLIENEWMDASHALFDVKALDPAVVSHDLFGGSLLIHRAAFLTAQGEALEAERARLIEEGWREAVVCQRDQVQDRLYAMEQAEPEYDAATTAKLARLKERREKLESREAPSEEAERRIVAALEQIDERERTLIAERPGTYSEATKAAGTVFLIMYPDGRVERQHRVPGRSGRSGRTPGSQGGSGNAGSAEANGPEPMPTSDELGDRQQAALYMQEAVAVREAAAKDRLVRKRLLVLALHDRVISDGLAIRREVNAIRLYAERSESFYSPLWDAQQARRREIDPLADKPTWSEAEAYAKIKELSDKQLDALIGVLVVESLTGHANRPTPLVELLREELGVSLRTHWTPDAPWLDGFRKAQLADLTGKLRGSAHGSAALTRKKSELVEELATLFSQAAATPTGFDDRELAERVNAWLPAVPSSERDNGDER